MSLEEFVEIAPNIYMFSPPNPRVGELVVLATWMGAADKHIAKYTALYRKLIPTARILLLKSVVRTMISSYRKQERDMEPAASAVDDILKECAGIPEAKPHMLLHMFSNGGMNSATHLLLELSRKRRQPMPLVGLICDSTPTGAGYRKTYSAFKYSFPQRFPANIIASLIIHVIIILLFASIYAGRYEHPEDYWRKSILDEKLISSKKIFYIASKADKLTDWNDVVAHAETARRNGWDVREIIYDDTPHCNHLKKDPQAYENAITEMWAKNKVWEV
jgi:hypothetical protein